MILSAYKSNQQAVMLFLPLVICLIWFFAFPSFAAYPTEEGQILGRLVFQWFVAHPVTARIFAMLLILGEATLLNRTFNKSEFAKRENYLPGFFYILFTGFTLQLQGLSQILVANLFIILLLSRLLQIYRQKNVYSEVFDAGILLGTATLFYLPVLGLLPLIWISLGIIRPFKWREWIIPLIGIAIPFFATFTYLYWTDQLGELADLPGWTGTGHRTSISNVYPALNWIGWAIIILLTVTGVYHVIRGAVSSTVRSSNVKMVLLVFLFFTWVVYIYSMWLPFPKFLIHLLAVPMALVVPFYFLNTRIKWLSAVVFYLVLIFLYVNYYFEYSAS